jgi:hypothetical protein
MKVVVRYTLCAAFCMLAACDPVVDNAIQALGSESNGVRPGPRHRPGQPCLLCHDGAIGDPREFSVAGTVFLHQSGSAAADGATIELHGADGTTQRVGANSAGNFYLSPGEFTPKFPLEVDVVYRGATVKMHGTIGRDGACASCHVDPAGPASPGQVYVLLEDGGVPQ